MSDILYVKWALPVFIEETMIHIERRLTRLLLGYIISFLFILVNNLFNNTR